MSFLTDLLNSGTPYNSSCLDLTSRKQLHRLWLITLKGMMSFLHSTIKEFQVILITYLYHEEYYMEQPKGRINVCVHFPYAVSLYGVKRVFTLKTLPLRWKYLAWI